MKFSTVHTPVWERLFKKHPEKFRFYPNEEFARFMGRHFFKLPKMERKHCKILEIGCGNGPNLWMAAKEGFQAYGLDGSPQALSLAHQTLKRWRVFAKLQLGDLQQTLPYPSNFFDGIFDVRAIECVAYSQHAKVYKEVFRVLKKKGWFFTFHGGLGSWDARHGGGQKTEPYTWEDVPNPNAIFPHVGQICFLPPQALESLLKKSGFRNVEIEVLEKTYQGRTRKFQYVFGECQKP